MKDTKHTNAPWIERVTPDGRAGIYAYGGSVRIATVEDAKNGAVIAAAPELLAALDVTLGNLRSLKANAFLHFPTIDIWIEEVERSITKARGLE